MHVPPQLSLAVQAFRARDGAKTDRAPSKDVSGWNRPHCIRKNTATAAQSAAGGSTNEAQRTQQLQLLRK